MFNNDNEIGIELVELTPSLKITADFTYVALEAFNIHPVATAVMLTVSLPEILIPHTAQISSRNLEVSQTNANIPLLQLNESSFLSTLLNQHSTLFPIIPPNFNAPFTMFGQGNTIYVDPTGMTHDNLGENDFDDAPDVNMDNGLSLPNFSPKTAAGS